MSVDRKVTFRVGADLWAKVLAFCRSNRVRPSSVIRAALESYLEKCK